MTGLSGPFVIVHTIGHVRDAVAASLKLGRPVTLISAPGAAAYMGPEVFLRMTEGDPGTPPPKGISVVIDCAADPGQALEALRVGLRHIRLDAADEVLAKFRDMTDGTVLDGAPINAYDMAAHDDHNGAERLTDWLQAESLQ
jgi:hypothetical protein